MMGVPGKAEIEGKLLNHMIKPGILYQMVLIILTAVVAWGIFAWSQQLRHGMIITGLSDQVFWGVNIATFLFFIRVSLAGTFLSAVLRILGYTWQAPITRLAEVITVASLLVAGTMRVVDIGRADRLLNVFHYGRLQSPLTWEVIVFTLYLVGSLIYLYLRMIPDLAVCRDRLSESVSSYRFKLYSKLAMGWNNSPDQCKKLEQLVKLMGLTIIFVAAAVQYVTTWFYVLTFRWGWNTTILIPYFVINGLMVALAVVIIMTTAFRRFFRLDKYFKLEEQYYRLGWLLLLLIAVSALFAFFELLPAAYKANGQEMDYLTLLFTGLQSSAFWSSVLGSLTIPALLICWPRTRTVAGLTAASILVIIGVWINKSYLFVVATLQVPLMPFYSLASYYPTWVEWSITLAGIAGFLLLITLFGRFFPIVAISELTSGGPDALCDNKQNKAP